MVEPINRLIDTVPFDLHCYSLDWHPADHVSFVDTVHLRKFHADSKVGDGGRPLPLHQNVQNVLSQYLLLLKPVK